MPVVLGKSKSLVPRGIKEIRFTRNVETKAIKMSIQIAKDFGQQSKKYKPKKITLR